VHQANEIPHRHHINNFLEKYKNPLNKLAILEVKKGGNRIENGFLTEKRKW
jgi:hypothetical protein